MTSLLFFLQKGCSRGKGQNILTCKMLNIAIVNKMDWFLEAFLDVQWWIQNFR